MKFTAHSRFTTNLASLRQSSSSVNQNLIKIYHTSKRIMHSRKPANPKVFIPRCLSHLNKKEKQRRNNKARRNHGKNDVQLLKKRILDTGRGRRLLDWPERNVIRQLSLQTASLWLAFVSRDALPAINKLSQRGSCVSSRVSLDKGRKALCEEKLLSNKEMERDARAVGGPRWLPFARSNSYFDGGHLANNGDASMTQPCFALVGNPFMASIVRAFLSRGSPSLRVTNYYSVVKLRWARQ